MSSIAVARFRGCLIGGLVGDCYGIPFENENDPRLRPQSMVADFLKKNVDDTQDSNLKGKTTTFSYSDDTEMAKSVALSLIENNGFDEVDMAKKFTTEYYKRVCDRGYGLHVVHVFQKLIESNFQNVYQPAKDQFNGEGSYGNGGAMRIAPVALFCYKSDLDRMIQIASQTTVLTHAHRDGYNGAILQCLAVDKALKASPLEAIDPDLFIDDLRKHMKNIETADPKNQKKVKTSYNEQLKNVKKALKLKRITDEVVTLLGNDITALRSVPIAIYAFLRGQQPLEEFETDNPFLRTLYLSLRLGGDTDTIGCMACNIAGAFYGIDFIPKNMREKCEDFETLLNIADKMAAVVEISNSY